MATQADAGDVPQVGEPYQESIEKAWLEASNAEYPGNTCAGVKGMSVRAPDTQQSQAALLICGVEIPVRYYNAYMDQVENGQKTCKDYMIEMATRLTALTISTNALESIAQAMPADDVEGATSALLQDTIRQTKGDSASTDPKRIIKDRLRERTRKLCPDFASVILR